MTAFIIYSVYLLIYSFFVIEVIGQHINLEEVTVEIVVFYANYCLIVILLLVVFEILLKSVKSQHKFMNCDDDTCVSNKAN